MTLVCCWLDQSSSRERITAIADARASYQGDDGKWVPLVETTTKLLPLAVNCHNFASHDPATSRFKDPYYVTEIVCGYSGYAFEALSIIELLRRCCRQLVTLGGNTPKPTPEGLVHLMAVLIERYFKGHKRPKEQQVNFVMFGYDENGAPWAAVLKHESKKKTEIERYMPLGEAALVAIGDGRSSIPMEALDRLRAAIARHSRKSSARMAEGFDRSLNDARHMLADRKSIEESALNVAESEFMETVGGTMQKLELYYLGEGEAVAAYSQDREEHILLDLPVVAADLGYAVTTQGMGRKN